MPMISSYRSAGIGYYFKLATSQTIPNTYYFGISTTPINTDGSGITEPSTASGYVRVALPNTSATWNDPTDGTVSNKIEIKFPELQVDSGTAVAYFLSDSISGNAFWYDQMTNPRPLAQYTTVFINPGEGQFALSNTSSI